MSSTPPLDSSRLVSSSKIQHVVIVVQENRSVDDLFNGLPGADTVGSGLDSKGKKVPLRPILLSAPYDIGHTHHSFELEYDKGKLDGFNEDDSRCFAINRCIAHDLRAYGYVPHSESKPYFAMAERYAFADKMFQTNRGPSFPAHQYLISGTSTIANGSSLRASENPATLTGLPTGGCDSPSGSLVPLIDEAGQEKQYVYPCFTRDSLMDLLDAKSLSWRYYQANVGPGLWNAPDAIWSIRRRNEYSADVITPPSQVLADIANGNLANVVWVTPTGAASDHARVTDGSGPSWVAAIVNAIGKSSYWDSTAILVTWDDWGGWYDHVPPPSRNVYELSFRVPLIVVSPYAKNHYVSHVQHEFGSILKFTEKVFGLGSLHTTDKLADDLFDCFDFSKSPAKFEPIPAPLPAKYFLDQRRGDGAPDDDADYSSTGYAALYSFAQHGKHNDGGAPAAHLLGHGGELYGTTSQGGLTNAACPLGCGTVYEIGGSGNERVLYRFTGGQNGEAPLGGLTLLDGAYYGTTSAGGTSTNCPDGCGVAFEMDSHGKERSIYTFAGATDGATPVAGMIAYGGALYGTTQFGGIQTQLCSSGCGTIFRLGASGTESVLHAFKGGTDGVQPIGGLINFNGTLYGTTQYGGAKTAFCATGCGTVFKIDPSSGALTVVYSFKYSPKNPDGAYPAARLVAWDGALYGTTEAGGGSSQGTVFKIAASGGESVIHSFSCCKTTQDGITPLDGLTVVNGTLYGTTRFGGSQARGAIFSVTTGGNESVLYSFGDRPDGGQPVAALESVGGELYGATLDGGATGEGMLFKIKP